MTEQNAESDAAYEYGLRIDCERNGCIKPHGDDGMILPRGLESEAIESVNGHAVTFVVREVTRSPWRDLARATSPEGTKADYLLDGSPEAVAVVRAARGLPSVTPPAPGVTPGGNPACPKCGRWYGPGIKHECPIPPAN